ncbi:MAG: TonB-dependent receptor [Gammaproteobacteria bacterium]|nr:TonB-dependent receptor [Gammaproteobacteria bacterium]MDH4255951.1 TonB-dependent receptor [Gammaproteobacteria bacterium]MDH5309866.1 TonB-dependent receptor [Gammaproteobacteria bacterium]
MCPASSPESRTLAVDGTPAGGTFAARLGQRKLLLGTMLKLLLRIPVRACIAIAAALLSAGAPAQEHSEDEEIEEIIVQATRSGRRADDEPIRVEVIGREEIEEKLLMRPGNIAMLVAETPGVRVQVTSPALGAANIRMQGMRGRYTQLLADGLPLYGGQLASIGLLQIPPTDLGQVEIIKGAASALYGASALGGVINLVSRRPGDEPIGELLVNLTSRDGQDLTAYASAPVGDAWSYSIVGGHHRQERTDLDGDGWIDMPGYERWTLRPRLSWDGQDGATVFLTAGAMTEQREGGTLPGRTVPDGSAYSQTQDSERFDAGLVADIPVGERATARIRASAMTQEHEHRYGTVLDDDRHDTYLAEAALAIESDRTSWLAGLAWQADAYRSDGFPEFDYTYRVPGAFMQVEHRLRDDVTLAGSARWDDHSEYGSRLSPRLSLLYRPGPWTIRASLGQGFFAPTPFVEEIEEAGLSRLEPLAGLRAETADTASLDAGRSFGAIEASLTLFASNISHAVRLEEFDPDASGSTDRVRLVNVDGATRTRGAELLLRYRRQVFTLTGSYVYLDASEPASSVDGRRAVPLTPRHAVGLVAMWEEHDRGRVGIEAYYTGSQPLENNPYRSEGRSYLHLGVLGELVLGNASLFLNLENILDVRQTDYDPLVLPAQAPDGRWTVDAWAPTDGFVVNGGFRLRFGGH